MANKIKVPSRDVLLSLYIDQCYSISALAREFNTSNPTVRNWLNEHGIERRSHKETSSIANKRNQTGKNKLPQGVLEKLSNRDWLYDQRINLGKSKDVIAGELGVSVTPVNKWIEKHRIPSVKYNQSSYKVMKILENKNDLQTLYDSGDTLELIARQLGTSKSTLSIFMRKHGIEMRPANSYEREKSFVSKEELEILDFVRSITNKEVLTNNRSIIGKEIDIYVPELGYAIEYNGVYFHTDKFKPKTSHYDKTSLCQEKGIKLFHLWSDDWKTKPEVIKSIISHNLGVTDRRIYARKCIVQIIDRTTAKQFLNDNHIQGDTTSSISIGVYHSGELVSVMTFGKPRFNKNYEWELIRFANKLNTSVIGSFSKILKYFRKLNEGSIVTYADKCYSYGDVYVKNGFIKIAENRPSYWYVVNGEKRVSRTQFMKNKFKDFDNTLSENDVMGILDIPKIWNSGTATFVLQ